MKNFDDILKAGKDKVAVKPTPVRQWKDYIATLMATINDLNDMYADAGLHHVEIEYCNCKSCRAASFLIVATDIAQADKVIRFHKAKWKAEGTNEYYCEKCKDNI